MVFNHLPPTFERLDLWLVACLAECLAIVRFINMGPSCRCLLLRRRRVSAAIWGCRRRCAPSSSLSEEDVPETQQPALSLDDVLETASTTDISRSGSMLPG